jgi:ATP-dependent Clp protease protease subunit
MNEQKLCNDFKKYALSKGISSMNLHYHEQNIEANMTPYILEEREMRVTQMDIFSRMMKDRIMWVAGEVNDQMSTIVQAQLLFLDSVEHNSKSARDIYMYVDTPGGSVKSGLSMVDVMRYITCDVATINTGMAASMGSVLLSSGTKKKRSALNFSKVMIHQLSSGTRGHIEDNRINQIESEKYNYVLFKILAENCGKTFDEVIESARRDKWFTSQEAKDFGLVDEVLLSKKQGVTPIADYLIGFDEYQRKELDRLK